jgi:hypothetical protein
VFLHSKSINGVQGMDVTLSMRVAVAAQACLLILNLDIDYFDNWVEVILYPGAFRVNHEQRISDIDLSDDERAKFGQAVIHAMHRISNTLVRGRLMRPLRHSFGGASSGSMLSMRGMSRRGCPLMTRFNASSSAGPKVLPCCIPNSSIVSGSGGCRLGLASSKSASAASQSSRSCPGAKPRCT